MGLRPIDSDITESLVGGHKELALCLDSLPQPRVLPTSHVLVQNTAGVVAILAKSLHNLSRQVFVDFDMHVPFS
jgi:hypothetical protein